MTKVRSDGFAERTANRRQREFVEDRLAAAIREDLEESIRVGALTKEEAADLATKTVAEWCGGPR